MTTALRFYVEGCGSTFSQVFVLLRIVVLCGGSIILLKALIIPWSLVRVQLGPPSPKLLPQPAPNSLLSNLFTHTPPTFS
ncbi:hypothetical protein MARHY0480 [Marinobacter nauticus ATCC 49840]|nr:hypothetical protein MARHY0480 [Marinobacter nauticus ATCC 49840]